MNVIQTLQERGFIDQMTHEAELYDFFDTEKATCYIGFDPSASSLHVGHLIPIMSLAHMQRAGHRPIALVGGGTGLIGDPSGKTEMRKMLTLEDVEENVKGIQSQLSNFIDFSDGKALMLNNAKWLTQLNYIEFLRDFGKHFSVNRMIKAESYKMRLDSEDGLSFLEFNYMVLQAYDFLSLFNDYACRLQLGGSDQWGNIIAGVELVRRVRRETVFGITFPLITTSSGEKMGKTAKGAVWLDPQRTTPYEYFQFWINTDDRDVPKFLSLFTFLPLDEIDSVKELDGAELNNIKTILAFEATRTAHGNTEAVNALNSAYAMFGSRSISADLLPSSKIHQLTNIKDDIDLPSTEINIAELQEGLPAFKVFTMTGLADSGGAARRLIKQGGAYINGQRIDNAELLIGIDDIQDNEILLRSGKKRYHKIIVKK